MRGLAGEHGNGARGGIVFRLAGGLLRTHGGQPITFAEWGYLGKGKFQRRDFRLDTLSQMSALNEEGSLFAHLGKHEIFAPAKTYPPMSVNDIASSALKESP